MRSLATLIMSSVALAGGVCLTATAGVAQDAPSNAELFRMFKAQQLKLARQEKLIGELRAELGRSRSTLEKTRRDVRRDNRQVRALAAEIGTTSGKDRNSRREASVSKAFASKVFASAPQRSSFSIDASYLYFRPYLTDTYFASTGTAAGSASGTLYGNNPDYNSAFRLGAAYSNGFTGRRLTASYTQLSASSHEQISGSSLWAARGSSDLLANFENYVGAATSDIGMNYRSANLLMSEPIDWGVSGLSFLYGAEFAQMDWNETEIYSRTGSLGVSTSSARFTGIGPQAGLSLTSKPFDRLNPLMAGFSLETRATAGLLLASSTSSISDIYNGTGIGSVQTQSMQRVIPVMHTRAALAYDYVWNDYSLAAKAGYEYHSYINGLQRLGNHDDVADGQYTVRYHNFDLGGFFAALKLTAGL